MQKVNYKGKDYIQVDSINGKPIIINEKYIKTYNIAGIDTDGSPLRTEGKAILNTADQLVGYYGADI